MTKISRVGHGHASAHRGSGDFAAIKRHIDRPSPFGSPRPGTPHGGTGHGGGVDVTTMALGEEGGGPIVSTMAVGEEGGGPGTGGPGSGGPIVTTQALGEEGGGCSGRRAKSPFGT